MIEDFWIVERWSRERNRWQQWSSWYETHKVALSLLILSCQRHPGRAFRIACYAREGDQGI